MSVRLRRGCVLASGQFRPGPERPRVGVVLRLNLEAVMLPAGEARVDLSDEAIKCGWPWDDFAPMVLARLPVGLLASERDV